MSPMLSTIVAAAVVLLGGIIAIWWLTGHIKLGFLRTLLRIVAFPLFVVLIVLFSLTMLRTQSNALPRAQTLITPIETMTVQPGTLTQTLSATGSLTPANQESLTFGASGPVTQVMVAVGDQVKAGQVLAQLDTTSIDSQIRSAQISLTQAQDSLNELQAPPSDLDVKIAQASIDAAQAGMSSASQSGPSSTDIQIANLQAQLAQNQLWQAQLNRDMSAASQRPNAPNAYANQIQTNASLDQSQISVQIAQQSADATANQGPNEGQVSSADAQLISAQANLDALLAGASQSDIQQAQIAVQTAQLQLNQIVQQRSNTTLVAPFDGIIAAVNIVPGELPPSGGAVTMIDTSGYTITLAVDEKDVPKIAVGQKVELSVQAVGGRATITGTVTRIDPAPTLSGQLVNYNVDVTLDSTQAPIRPGMSAVADVIIQQLDNVLVVPNRFITTNSATQRSTVMVETAPGTFAPIPVTLGTVTDTESQIVSGLNVGQTIVILGSGTSGAAGRAGGLFGGGAGFGGPGAGGFGGAGAGGFAGGARPAGGGFTGGGRGG